MERYLLCCDWGTTSFRLRLVNRENQTVIGEVLSQNGIGNTFNHWKEIENNGISRETFFRQELKQHIDLLAEKVALNLDGIPMVLSGMASSSLGIQEIAYATLPFSLDGKHTMMRHFEQGEDFPHDILLLSGVCSNHDVMRGEETELIGLIGAMDLGDKDAIFIFPGTHSKHMFVRDGRLIDFKTYMTGEVFNLMARHSILRDSVELDDATYFSENARESFITGIRESGYGDILNTLFTVRTNQLFDLLDKKQNAMFLSGLLIGAEMRHLTKETGTQLVLCCQNNLFKLYNAAIEALNLSGRTTIIPAMTVGRAATIGQIKIFEHQNLTLNKTNL
ncbi:MAG: 2-dehydro-3-deoxygalactonokinase [Dyadobacter sp.]|uniref:2-dehydro-3-deoxygalactonokinase n=1 Tax=Dyadobacter sp. TaxID=1914288 RepID=UPI00326723C4